MSHDSYLNNYPNDLLNEIENFIKNYAQKHNIYYKRILNEIFNTIRLFILPTITKKNLILFNINNKNNSDLIITYNKIKNTNDFYIKLGNHTHCNNLYLEIKNTHYKNVIRFEFSQNNLYPFHPPLVYIDQLEYFYYLKKFNTEFLYIINNNYNCLCCQTIISKWTPTITIINILKEIYQNLEYKKLYYIYIYIKAILKKNSICDDFSKKIFKYYIKL